MIGKNQHTDGAELDRNGDEAPDTQVVVVVVVVQVPETVALLETN